MELNIPNSLGIPIKEFIKVMTEFYKGKTRDEILTEYGIEIPSKNFIIQDDKCGKCGKYLEIQLKKKSEIKKTDTEFSDFCSKAESNYCESCKATDKFFKKMDFKGYEAPSEITPGSTKVITSRYIRPLFCLTQIDNLSNLKKIYPSFNYYLSLSEQLVYFTDEVCKQCKEVKKPYILKDRTEIFKNSIFKTDWNLKDICFNCQKENIAWEHKYKETGITKGEAELTDLDILRAEAGDPIDFNDLSIKEQYQIILVQMIGKTLSNTMQEPTVGQLYYLNMAYNKGLLLPTKISKNKDFSLLPLDWNLTAEMNDEVAMKWIVDNIEYYFNKQTKEI